MKKSYLFVNPAAIQLTHEIKLKLWLSVCEWNFDANRKETKKFKHCRSKNVRVWTKRGLGATKKSKDKPQVPQEMQDSTQRSHPQNTPSCSEIQTKALFSIVSSAKVGSNMSTTQLFYNRVNSTN
jgi:hypothetical protein